VWEKTKLEVTNDELSDRSNINDLNVDLRTAQDKLVATQMQIATRTQEFANKPEVKEYNDLVDENDLRRPTLTADEVIDLRIKAAETAKDLTKVEELNQLKAELKVNQVQYNSALESTMKSNQDVSTPKETPVEVSEGNKNTIIVPENVVENNVAEDKT
jgi:hypothetical protein